MIGAAELEKVARRILKLGKKHRRILADQTSVRPPGVSYPELKDEEAILMMSAPCSWEEAQELAREYLASVGN